MAKERAKPKGPKIQPSPYDWIGLETEYLAGDNQNIAQFFRDKKISQNTHKTHTVGWPQKWQALRQRGLELFQNKRAKEIAAMAEAHHAIGSAIMKVGVDSLMPKDKGGEALKPKSAAEGARMIQIGAQIQQNAAQLGLPEAKGGHAPSVPIDPNQAPVVQILINLPANTKEGKTV